MKNFRQPLYRIIHKIQLSLPTTESRGKPLVRPRRDLQSVQPPSNVRIEELHLLT